MIDFYVYLREYYIITILFILYGIFAIVYALLYKNKKFLFGYSLLVAFFVIFIYTTILVSKRRKIIDNKCQGSACTTIYNRR